MTGLENYNRTINFNGPAYLPCSIKVNLDWMYEKHPAKRERICELAAQFPDDLVGWVNAACNATEPVCQNGVQRWTDEWLTEWVNDGHGAKTDSYPLSQGYHLLDNYPFPNPYREDRFTEPDKRLKNRCERYVQAAVWFTLFERLWMLRGFENLLMDPYANEHEFYLLRDRIVEYNLQIIDLWLERGVNAVFFSDDWGSQHGLLINPDDWRRFYKPSYKRMFERVHSGNAHVWMHLCGNITAILPDLIDIGLNVLNPVQPQAMDVKELSREFGGKVCFNGGVDVQGTLILGRPDDVKREVHQLVNLFGRFNGGYIGETSHSIMPETPLDNIIAVYEAFLEYQTDA
ncbi:hypothetical protein JW960_18250 [candidate division KSB1 bacterium]|nr:hypothetical protein [candidate division KSB1 bacterium]